MRRAGRLLLAISLLLLLLLIVVLVGVAVVGGPLLASVTAFHPHLPAGLLVAVWTIVALGFAMLLAIGTLIAVGGWVARHRLSRDGVPGHAEVVICRDARDREGNGPVQVELCLAIDLPGRGTRWRVYTGDVSPAQFDRLANLTACSVYVDPQRLDPVRVYLDGPPSENAPRSAYVQLRQPHTQNAVAKLTLALSRTEEVRTSGAPAAAAIESALLLGATDSAELVYMIQAKVAPAGGGATTVAVWHQRLPASAAQQIRDKQMLPCRIDPVQPRRAALDPPTTNEPPKADASDDAA